MRKKFVQTLDPDVYETLRIVARENGVPVQEFLRRIVIPDWMLIASQRYRRIRRRSQGAAKVH